jgi:hypothetical protein
VGRKPVLPEIASYALAMTFRNKRGEVKNLLTFLKGENKRDYVSPPPIDFSSISV